VTGFYSGRGCVWGGLKELWKKYHKKSCVRPKKKRKQPEASFFQKGDLGVPGPKVLSLRKKEKKHWLWGISYVKKGKKERKGRTAGKQRNG